jgi:hypothetical protein
MCPATSESKDIRIYKCVEFPLRWQLHKILMRDVSAVGTNIFRYKEKFWMLTNVDSSTLGDHGSELHIFYADTFDSNEWIAHPNNPVVFDSTKARNAGLIIDGDEIYRIFQVQGFHVCGASMGISKIVELNTHSYREDVICEIPPKFFSKLKGAHTLSYDKGVLLIDFVKYESYKN